MKCLSAAESLALMSTLGFEPAGQAIVTSRSDRPTWAEWRITDSAARQSLMVNAAFDLLPRNASCLLWLREWGVWPSSEFPALWYEIRERNLERRSLEEAPGHLFSVDERELARGMARLAVLFGWDALITSIPSPFVISTLHDELFWLLGADTAALEELTATLGPPDRQADFPGAAHE